MRAVLGALMFIWAIPFWAIAQQISSTNSIAPTQNDPPPPPKPAVLKEIKVDKDHLLVDGNRIR